MLVSQESESQPQQPQPPQESKSRICSLRKVKEDTPEQLVKGTPRQPKVDAPLFKPKQVTPMVPPPLPVRTVRRVVRAHHTLEEELDDHILADAVAAAAVSNRSRSPKKDRKHSRSRSRSPKKDRKRSRSRSRSRSPKKDRKRSRSRSRSRTHSRSKHSKSDSLDHKIEKLLREKMLDEKLLQERLLNEKMRSEKKGPESMFSSDPDIIRRRFRKTLCRHFILKGKCDLGDDCNFSHIKPYEHCCSICKITFIDPSARHQHIQSVDHFTKVESVYLGMLDSIAKEKRQMEVRAERLKRYQPAQPPQPPQPPQRPQSPQPLRSQSLERLRQIRQEQMQQLQELDQRLAQQPPLALSPGGQHQERQPSLPLRPTQESYLHIQLPQHYVPSAYHVTAAQYRLAQEQSHHRSDNDY